ncbi:arginase family protein [Rhizobium sp. YTU87027]|uniref:arginase family protein n=1 Tax=Rhizobium sp. YTU87027 TaxID=3417741 RepID=UPI003D69AD67
MREPREACGTKERQRQFGVKSLSPAEVAESSAAVLEWLSSIGASKVLVHFDLDVIDPVELIVAVGTDPDGMKSDGVIRVVDDIARQFDIVGPTIAEQMPRVAIKLRNMLARLPLLR